MRTLPPEDPEEVKALWIQYRAKPTAHVRQLFVKKYQPLVYKIAAGFVRKSPTVLDYDDLISAGMIGLLDAIERYDPENERKAQFQTYATWRVRGAILDEINSMDWTPRSMRENIKSVLNAIERHHDNHPEKPSVEQLVERTELDQETVQKVLLHMEKTYIIPVEHETMEAASSTFSGASQDEETSSTINLTIKKDLTELERQFIMLKFYSGYNHREIQAMLDLTVTEMRQVKDAAYAKLVSALGIQPEGSVQHLLPGHHQSNIAPGMLGSGEF